MPGCRSKQQPHNTNQQQPLQRERREETEQDEKEEGKKEAQRGEDGEEKEREKERRGERGRTEQGEKNWVEEKNWIDEGGIKVVEVETDWITVRRRTLLRRRPGRHEVTAKSGGRGFRDFQIFVKMDDSKAVTTDAAPSDEVSDVMRRISGM